jgi:hypothetical protein
MKGTACFSMVGTMVQTANTTDILQGYCGDHSVGFWPLATAVIKNPRPYTTRLPSEGISQIKDLFSNLLSLKKIKHSAE